jgi:ABC-type transporter Mla MlaB component
MRRDRVGETRRRRPRQAGGDAIAAGPRSKAAFEALESNMQIRTSIETSGAITLAVTGHFTAASIAPFERALEQARRCDQLLFLDLTGVTGIDRAPLAYVVRLMQHDFRLIICPAFVERCIARDGAGARMRG